MLSNNIKHNYSTFTIVSKFCVAYVSSPPCLSSEKYAGLVRERSSEGCFLVLRNWGMDKPLNKFVKPKNFKTQCFLLKNNVFFKSWV